MRSRRNVLGRIRRRLAWKDRSGQVPTSKRGHCTLFPSPLSFSFCITSSLTRKLHHTAKQLHRRMTWVRATPRAGALVAPSDRPFKPFIFLTTCTRMNPYPGVACLREPAFFPSWPNFFTHDTLSARTIGSSHVNGIQTTNLWGTGVWMAMHIICLKCTKCYFIRGNNINKQKIFFTFI